MSGESDEEEAGCCTLLATLISGRGEDGSQAECGTSSTEDNSPSGDTSLICDEVQDGWPQSLEAQKPTKNPGRGGAGLPGSSKARGVPLGSAQLGHPLCRGHGLPGPCRTVAVSPSPSFPSALLQWLPRFSLRQPRRASLSFFVAEAGMLQLPVMPTRRRHDRCSARNGARNAPTCSHAPEPTGYVLSLCRRGFEDLAGSGAQGSR